MIVSVRCVTDPACIWSWAFEPVVRALMVEFGEDLEWTFAMGGLAQSWTAEDRERMVHHWLEAADESGMPVDPLGWWEAPLSSSHPACRAVKAAERQDPAAAARYLRALREGICALRRPLDDPDELATVATESGLDGDRVRADLDSPEVAAALAADFEEARRVPQVARDAGKVRCSRPDDRERVPFPTLRFDGADGTSTWTCGVRPLEFVRERAVAAGARPSGAPRPDPLGALGRFGRMATVEVAAVCAIPAAVAEAELAELARDGTIEATPVLTGRLWHAAGR